MIFLKYTIGVRKKNEKNNNKRYGWYFIENR